MKKKKTQMIKHIVQIHLSITLLHASNCKGGKLGHAFSQGLHIHVDLQQLEMS